MENCSDSKTDHVETQSLAERRPGTIEGVDTREFFRWFDQLFAISTDKPLAPGDVERQYQERFQTAREQLQVLFSKLSKQSKYPIESFYSPKDVRQLVEDLYNNLKSEIAKLETKKDVDDFMEWLCSDE